MHPPVGPALYSVLGHFEAVRQTMYLDSASPPLVTVGIGFMIDPFAAALALGLGNWSRRGGGAVTESDLRTEWNLVKNPQTRPAGWQAQLMLRREAMRPLFDREARRREGVLRRLFPHFDNCPADAQLGMLCVSWVRSSQAGIRSEFPDFVGFCGQRDWRRAGPASLWAAIRDATGGQDSRRVQRRFAMLRMFDNAAVVEESNSIRPHSIPIQRLFYPHLAAAPSPAIAEQIQARRQSYRYGR